MIDECSKKCAEASDITVEMGIPSKLILLIAKEKNCDFIVMGMKGKGKTLNDALMGDTVRRVLHQAKQPVLVVSPQEAAVQETSDKKDNVVALDR